MIASQKKCNLCGKTGFRIVCHHPQGSLGQCVNCGLIFSPQQLPDKEHLKQYGASYYQQKDEDSPGLDYFAYEQCWLEGSRKKLAAIGEAIGGGRLLDVGCGVGFFLKVAREEGWDVMGVEVSKWAAEKAREMYDLDVINSTFEAAHFEDGSFDVVTLWHVLEHCPSPTKTLEHCHEILRPGGLIALEVPNVESRAARRSLLRWEHTAPQEHLFYFGPRTLQKILVKTGFMNVKVEKSGGTGLLKKGSAAVPGGLKRFVGRHYDKLKWLKVLLEPFFPRDQFIMGMARRPEDG